MTVETQHLERDVLAGSSSRGKSVGWKEEYQTIISDAETADRERIGGTYTSEFLDNTDFEDSYLIVVQNGMQSTMELVLDAISRREDGLHLDISIDSPMSGPDDLLIHSLLVRITDEEEGIPEEMSVDITGYV